LSSKEKIIVIGSNSFSGASFIDYVLKENPLAEIIGISRSSENRRCFLPYKKNDGSRFHFYRLDLNRDLKKIMKVVRQFEPHFVVNFAAQGMVGQSWQEPQQWFQTNCLAMMNFAKNLTQETYLKRYVHISSPEVYGSCQNITEEEAVLRPSTPYAASKACGDLSLYPFFATKGFPLTYTRATNVYGPYQQLYRIIPRTIYSIKKGLKIPLEGGGRAVKSYIHIKDVCDVTLKIARSGNNGEVYHISPDGNGISIRELVELICEIMKVSFSDAVEMTKERMGQDAVYIINSQKVRREFSWKPQINLRDGLLETIRWIEEFLPEFGDGDLHYRHKP